MRALRRRPGSAATLPDGCGKALGSIAVELRPDAPLLAIALA